MGELVEVGRSIAAMPTTERSATRTRAMAITLWSAATGWWPLGGRGVAALATRAHASREGARIWPDFFGRAWPGRCRSATRLALPHRMFRGARTPLAGHITPRQRTRNIRTRVISRNRAPPHQGGEARAARRAVEGDVWGASAGPRITTAATAPQLPSRAPRAAAAESLEHGCLSSQGSSGRAVGAARRDGHVRARRRCSVPAVDHGVHRRGQREEPRGDARPL